MSKKIRYSLSVESLIITITLAFCIDAHSSDNNEVEIKRRLHDAEMLFSQKKYSTSIDALEKLALDYPDNAEIQFKLGAIRMILVGGNDRGRIPSTVLAKEGLSNLGRAAYLDPSNIEYLAAYSTVAGDMHQDALAVENFRKLFKKAGMRTDARYRYLITNYYISLERIGQRDIGLAELKTSLEETDYDSRIAIGYIGALGYAKDIANLQKFYSEFVSKKGHQADVAMAVCYEIAASERYDLAKNCFDKISENTKFSKKDRDSAIKHLKRIRALEWQSY